MLPEADVVIPVPPTSVKFSVPKSILIDDELSSNTFKEPDAEFVIVIVLPEADVVIPAPPAIFNCSVDNIIPMAVELSSFTVNVPPTASCNSKYPVEALCVKTMPSVAFS